MGRWKQVRDRLILKRLNVSDNEYNSSTDTPGCIVASEDAPFKVALYKCNVTVVATRCKYLQSWNETLSYKPDRLRGKKEIEWKKKNERFPLFLYNFHFFFPISPLLGKPPRDVYNT